MSTLTLTLPRADGTLAPYTMRASPFSPIGVASPASAPPRFNRVAYAAAHVVANPRLHSNPWDETMAVDWEATLAFRTHLYRLGFGVAEAMDTAQRGMGVDWPTARELIRRSIRHARTIPGAALVCGVGTEQLSPGPQVTLAQVEAAYREQLAVVEEEGGQAVLMASRALVKAARSADDYIALYQRLMRDATRPVVLHWLGEMFDPHLAGYWGTSDISQAMHTVLRLIESMPEKVAGIKMSLLEERWELELRRQLPGSVMMFTGDDFNYAPLIEGDGTRHSHALLGIFDAIAPVASAALASLALGTDAGRARFRELIAPTVPLSREIFCAPTRYYKAGVVFLAWLNGHQNHFSMAGGLQSSRSAAHYARVFQLSDACGLLAHPELAYQRMSQLMQVMVGK